MERIDVLRAENLSFTAWYDEFFLNYYRQYEKHPELGIEERYADAYYHAFDSITPDISDGELIVGKYHALSEADSKEWQEKYMPMMREVSAGANRGQDSHMAIDYEMVLAFGLNGIIARLDGYISTCSDGDKLTFYKACRRCLEAVIKCSENHADKALELAKSTTDEQRRRELETIAEICRRVPANPAESFYEAVQAVHFISLCLSLNPLRYRAQQFQLGQPDRYLLPYYLRDIESCKITKEFAGLLIDCLNVQMNNRVPSGVSTGYMVGGTDENNRPVANELTLMLMQTVDNVRLVYPAVGFCYAEGMDDLYLKKACEILSHGRSHPAIFNDRVIVDGLKSYGVPEAEAHNYIHSTCVEITPIASSNVWVASPYTNMPQLLLDILDREYKSLDELMLVYFGRLDARIRENLDEQLLIRKERHDHSMNPLVSCLVNDCLERGLDIEKGGARYNWIMPSFVGVANLVDSLYVLKKLVFDNKEMTIGELKAILDDDFKGHEDLRHRILSGIDKYGNDVDDIDKYFGMITDHIIAECKKHTGVYTNARLIPSVFCWIMHEKFGRDTGATPDGRVAGFPLGDGSGPCQGREANGPTASILSSTKWDHHELIGGVAVNMKFWKKSLGDDAIETMMNLVKVYIQRGGFEMQINVVDKDTLERAVVCPEEYRDLVVRVGGYSDYFVRLSKEMQQEIILRTEHRI